MEITLEKIELVKDRTGVTYKEAKEALEAANGNVVDAIVAIEESIDEKSAKKIGAQGEELIAKMKETVKKGNVSRILVTKDEEVLINIPLNIGLLGTVVAPWGMIAGVVAAFGFKCKIEFVKDDGSIIDISAKAADVYEDAKEKGTGIYADLKEKAPGFYEDLKEKSGEAFEKAKDAAKEVKDKFAKEVDDLDIECINLCDKDCESCEEPCEDKCDDCKFDECHACEAEEVVEE
ncbi:MAG: DUF4342 domain-containing protein [Firmicutes bacterium]|nr:DUF4342 domain-containing protein [Bacillota bacterium]